MKQKRLKDLTFGDVVVFHQGSLAGCYRMFIKLYTISTQGSPNGEYFVVWLDEDGKITNRIMDLNPYRTYQTL